MILPSYTAKSKQNRKYQVTKKGYAPLERAPILRMPKPATVSFAYQGVTYRANVLEDGYTIQAQGGNRFRSTRDWVKWIKDPHTPVEPLTPELLPVFFEDPENNALTDFEIEALQTYDWRDMDLEAALAPDVLLAPSASCNANQTTTMPPPPLPPLRRSKSGMAISTHSYEE